MDMKTTFLAMAALAAASSVAGAAAGSASDRGDRFTDEEPLAIDLRGGTRRVAEWQQRKWNGQPLSVANGTLVFEKSVGVHGGKIDIAPGATLRFARGCSLGTGLGDAGTRVFDVPRGATLDMDGVSWRMDHTRVVVHPGGFWNADLSSFSLEGAMKNNLWKIGGKASFPRGVRVRKGDWGHEMEIVLEKGGEMLVGGPVTAEGAKKCKIGVVLEGGTLRLFWDARFAPGTVRLAPGAKVDVHVSDGVDFDESSVAPAPGAKLVVKRGAKEPDGLPHRFPVEVKYDRTGRSYWLSLDSSREEIAEIAVKYPNPDRESPLKYGTYRTKDTLFRRRFPAGEGPWTVFVGVRDRKGGKTLQKVVVEKPAETIRQPAPNSHIMTGLTGYGDAHDLTRDILKEDLCNLYVGWHTAAKLLPENAPEDIRGEWAKAVKERKTWAMSIYSGDGRDLQEKLAAAFPGRYLGNNVGEYASFMYQGRENCGIPMDLDLASAKEQFVNRYIGKAGFGWMANFPRMFSTCGAALSCYELAGGIDFICNEQWAIGAQNIAHTTAEARGAARKWGPEWWCAWNAHEWQTCAIPYRHPAKYDSCLAGFLLEYVCGTSMIVLESGSQGKQAWQYTADFAGQPKEERAQEGYDGYVARNYRATVKKFYEWTKANPRREGTPETKIAMALGNLDAYLGQDGGFTVWSQHDNAATNSLWKYGAPEKTQALLEDVFFPRPRDLLTPEGEKTSVANAWLGGTPYGQADVMQVDDESTIADLRRYDLLVFGGWNTMTELSRDLLERYVREGGTLVMSRPELTKLAARDLQGCADGTLAPLFGFLPPPGKPGDFAEKKVGKGRYFLFTAPEFPAASKEGAEAYEKLVRSLASGVEQTVRLEREGTGAADAIAYAVYGGTAYFLNTDVAKKRRISFTAAGRRESLELAPCEVKIVEPGRRR